MRRRLAVLLAVPVVCGLASFPALTSAGAAAAAAPDPSGLSLLRVGEAGHETLTDTGPNGDPFQVDTTIEPSIAVNPANPDEIVTGFQTGRDDAGGGVDNGFATSHDMGRTWVSGALPGVTSATGNSLYLRASDAVVAWGPGETVYYSSLVFDPTGANLRSGIANSTSHDGGLTWDAPTTVQDDLGAGLNDKNWTTVDLGTGSGHHFGRVYVVWDRVAGIFTKYSDDGGLTWNPPSPVLTPLTFQGQGIGSLPMVLPNGDFAVAFESETLPPPLNTPGEDLGEAVTGMTAFAVAVARGAGTLPTGSPLAFTPAISLATYEGTAVRGQRAGSLLDAAMDPRTGRMYVAWEDSRFRTDSNNDIAIAHSDDEGLTWTQPARVNGGPTGDQVDHYDPSLDVGPDSSVRVMWRQRQETASDDVTTYAPYISTMVAQSADGTTFLPALDVDRGINDGRYGAFSRNGIFQGDYDELVTLGDTSYLVYCESFAADGEAPPEMQGDGTVHHQRTVVSIVRPYAAAAPTAPATTAPPASAPPVSAPPTGAPVSVGPVPSPAPSRRPSPTPRRTPGAPAASAFALPTGQPALGSVRLPRATLAFTGLDVGVPALGVLGLVGGLVLLRRRRP